VLASRTTFLPIFLGFAVNIFAQSPPSNAELTPVLRELCASVSSEQCRQLTEAIEASASLAGRLNGLASTGALTAIKVVPVSDIPSAKRALFRGVIDGTKIIVSTELLADLQKKRLFDVVYDDDILPNNTTFVLSHLAYHIGEAAKTNNPKPPLEMLAYIAMRLHEEAAGFLQAWNDTLDAAVHDNRGQALSSRQVAQLLLNARYRFALLTFRQPPEKSLVYGPTGALELSEHNIAVVLERLKTSSVTDIE
jgi:hypothetical protein